MGKPRPARMPSFIRWITQRCLREVWEKSEINETESIVDLPRGQRPPPPSSSQRRLATASAQPPPTMPDTLTTLEGAGTCFPITNRKTL